MITGKDARMECREAKKIVDSDATIEEKMKALYKVMEVGIKIMLSTRISLVRVMEKLEVEKVKPRTTREQTPKVEDKDTTKE